MRYHRENKADRNKAYRWRNTPPNFTQAKDTSHREIVLREIGLLNTPESIAKLNSTVKT